MLPRARRASRRCWRSRSRSRQPAAPGRVEPDRELRTSRSASDAVDVADVDDGAVVRADRGAQMRPKNFLAANVVRLAARHQCQCEPEWKWKDVHDDSFQLWP